MQKSFAETLRQLCKSFEECGLRFALIGGVAVILRGYDRGTIDVDAVAWDVDAHLDELLAALRANGFELRENDGVEFARRYRVILLNGPEGVQVDVSMGALPFEREVIERTSLEQVDSITQVPVATTEDLVIMKLVASRRQDLDDVRALLDLYPLLDKSRIRSIVLDYADALDEPAIIENMGSLLGTS